MRTATEKTIRSTISALLSVCLVFAVCPLKSTSAADETLTVRVDVDESGDSTLVITTTPPAPVTPSVIEIDSLGVVIEIPEAPMPPEPLAPAAQAPVFVKTVLEEGELRSWDESGRVWEYDYEDGVYILRWDRDQTRGRRIRSRYISGYDTVIVYRDRSEDWAQERLHIPRFCDEPILVGESEYVVGSIDCTDRIEVSGLVIGNVRTFGEVIVTESGVIDGNVSAVSIDIQEGGIITGREKQSPQSFLLPQDFDQEFRELIDFGAVPIFIGIAGLLLLVAFIALSVSPNALTRTSQTISRYPQRSFWIGLVGIPVYLLAIVVVAVTFVGIPLALLMILALPWAVLVGIVSHTQYVGSLALAAYGRSPESGRGSSIKRTALGAAILMTLWAAAIALLNSRSDYLSSWGLFLLVVSIVVSAIATASGFGAVALTRFGRREYVPHAAERHGNEPPPPTPPPIPGSSPAGPQPPQPPAPLAPPTPPDLPTQTPPDHPGKS